MATRSAAPATGPATRIRRKLVIYTPPKSSRELLANGDGQAVRGKSVTQPKCGEVLCERQNRCPVPGLAVLAVVDHRVQVNEVRARSTGGDKWHRHVAVAIEATRVTDEALSYVTAKPLSSSVQPSPLA